MGIHALRLCIGIIALSALLGIASGISIPNAFYGDVLIGSQKAPDGTKVNAEINGVEYVRATISNGQYNINVPSDDPVTPQKEGGKDGETVVFYVNGVKAGEKSFKSGDITKLGLSITQEAVPQAGRVVKTPDAALTDSPASPPAAPPQVTPGETPILTGANEPQAKGEQGRSTMYVLIIAAIVIIIIYFVRIRK